MLTMNSLGKKTLGLGLLLGACLLPSLVLLVSPLFAAGEYARGRKVISVVKFESSGIVCESWEGVAVEASYNKSEKCNAEDDECYTPISRRFRFSVSTKNAKTVNFIRKNLNREMLALYKIHRVEAFCLSSDFEVLDVYPRRENPPAGFQRKLIVDKSGTRNYSVYGKILKLEYIGTVSGTFEGLYLDVNKRKVVPFSIKYKKMARYASSTMFFRKAFHIGISRSRVISGLRKTKLDFFEINYDEEAGGIQVPASKKKKK